MYTKKYCATASTVQQCWTHIKPTAGAGPGYRTLSTYLQAHQQAESSHQAITAARTSKCVGLLRNRVKQRSAAAIALLHRLAAVAATHRHFEAGGPPAGRPAAPSLGAARSGRQLYSDSSSGTTTHRAKCRKVSVAPHTLLASTCPACSGRPAGFWPIKASAKTLFGGRMPAARGLSPLPQQGAR